MALTALVIFWAALTAYNLGLFCDYNYFAAQRDIAAGKVRLVMIGELPPHVAALDSIAAANGLSFYYTGCEVTAGELRGTGYYNEAMVAHLKYAHNTEWWDEFNAKFENIAGYALLID